MPACQTWKSCFRGTRQGFAAPRAPFRSMVAVARIARTMHRTACHTLVIELSCCGVVRFFASLPFGNQMRRSPQWLQTQYQPIGQPPREQSARRQ